MSSAITPNNMKSNRGSFGAYMGNGSLLVEKAKTHAVRRSTPDSEALASSDEEHDGLHGLSISIHSSQGASQGPPRRMSTSWLSEVQPRKMSLGAASHTSNSSQPPTPSGEFGPWGMARAAPAVNTYFNLGKGTSGLSDVVESPTSFTVDEQHLRSPPIRDTNPSIPFKFPEYPQRKAVRSQSYSVGQQEAESSVSFSGRTRTNTLRHRPSQPSLLSEPPHNATSLGLLREDEDDMESSNGSEQGVRLPSLYHVKPDSEVHGLLKQAAVENARSRHRASTAGSPLSRHRQRLNSTGFTESDYAIDENEDTSGHEHAYNPAGASNTLVRRFSEQLAPADADDGMKNGSRARWQSSLGFGGVGSEGAQSRRHSFADVPTHIRAARLGYPLSNTYEEDEEQSGVLGAGLAPPLSPGQQHEIDTCECADFHKQALRIESETVKVHNGNRLHAANYFNGTGPALKNIADYSPTTGEDGNPYAVPDVLQSPQKDLYMVSFKCARADVFYIPENTGLEVKKGDLVIVEGDRGIDLGTVTHAKVTWEEAKKLKDESVEQHYKWLMMFSRHVQSANSGISHPSGMFAASGGQQGSAVGGMGPEAPFAQAVALSLEDILRPKMIKRLAQNHEVQTLREKEGAEAKAKRICQQKSIEHGLPMEILDAEYQIDMKKLTFFYYAEAYINFNELVTDLFKMYKTRIWLSAVNPASFPAPTGPHGPHGPHGPGTRVSHGGGSRRIHAPVTAPMSIGTSAATSYSNGSLYPANDQYGAGTVRFPYYPNTVPFSHHFSRSSFISGHLRHRTQISNDYHSSLDYAAWDAGLPSPQAFTSPAGYGPGHMNQQYGSQMDMGNYGQMTHGWNQLPPQTQQYGRANSQYNNAGYGNGSFASNTFASTTTGGMGAPTTAAYTPTSYAANAQKASAAVGTRSPSGTYGAAGIGSSSTPAWSTTPYGSNSLATPAPTGSGSISTGSASRHNASQGSETTQPWYATFEHLSLGQEPRTAK